MAGKLLLAFRHCPFQLLLLLASTQFGKFLENTAGGNWSKLFEAFAIFVIKRTKPNIGSGILLIVQAMSHRGRGDWWSVGAFGVAFLGEGVTLVWNLQQVAAESASFIVVTVTVTAAPAVAFAVLLLWL